jgi:hypothetical protein
MLDNAATQDDHAGVNAEHGEPVDPSQVIQNVDYLHMKVTGWHTMDVKPEH